MVTAAAVLPGFGSPNIFAGMWGDMLVCCGCKRHLGFNTDVTCSPKPCPCHAAQGTGSTSTGKGFLLCSTRLEEALWMENSISGHSVLTIGQCFVCAVTPVRSLLHTPPEVEQGFWKTAVERLGGRRRAQGEVLITAMPVPGKGEK